jgi:hypothetical protein
MRLLPLHAALLCLLFASPAWAALPEDDGPFTGVAETDTVQAGPSQVQATVCLTSAPGPRPIIALAPSLLEPRDTLASLCLHLSTYGFIAVVPDLGFANSDASSIGQTLLDALAFLVREGDRPGSRFAGHVDGVHRVVLGHNTGALGAVWAAQADDTLSAAILLDPQELNGQGRNAATHVVHVPVLVVQADPGACNGNGAGDGLYAALASPRSTLHVYASSDCDAEFPASGNCQGACGASHLYGAKYFRRFATAYAAFFAGCNGAMKTHLDGSALDELVGSRTVDRVQQAALPDHCGPFATLDAGAPSVDAGAPVASGCSSHAQPAALWPVALTLVLLALGLGRGFTSTGR